MDNTKNILDSIKEASEIIKESKGFVAILTHYDADGLSSGGALLRLLYMLGKEGIVRSVSDLNEYDIKNFFRMDAAIHIISDMGSGDLRLIKKFLRDFQVDQLMIIDHHKVLEDDVDHDKIKLVNPELYGLDGGAMDCSAVLASYLGYLSTGDTYFYIPGLIGASGDMQLLEPKDLTKVLLEEAYSRGLVSKVKDFIFFSNRFLPIHKAITWTFYPYIPNFSGRDDIGLSLVREAGIKLRRSDGSFRTVNDLSDMERNQLLEKIVEYLANIGIVDLGPKDLMREYFVLTLESDPLLKYLDDFTNIVNATGRMGYEFIGISLSAGVRGNLVNLAHDVYMKRRKTLAEYLSKADKNIKIYDDKILVIDLTGDNVNPRFSGTIATLYSKSLKYRDKIVFVLTPAEDGIKISARAPKEDVTRGLNLAELMKILAGKYGGRGGGHNVAAGATIKGDVPQVIHFLVENTISMMRSI